MADKLDSAIVRDIIEVGSNDPLSLLLVTYLGAAYHASLFNGFIAFIGPHQEQICQLLDGHLDLTQMKIVRGVANHLQLVYRLAVFDSFLNNLTSYALAARPSKAIREAKMPVSVLLAKTRANVVNDCIARRTKSLARESYRNRIQELRDICEIDFRLDKDDVDKLKRLSDLRNAIVHEGSAFQFTVDDDLKIKRHAETQRVNLSTSENIDLINRIAASLYEQYVTRFIGRDLHQIEQGAVDALSNRPKPAQVS
jgi:hypothetical protein